MAKKNELVVIDTATTSIIPSAEDMAAIQEELQDIDSLQYGRIKIGSGGANVFNVTDPGDEEEQTVMEVEGVIIMSHKCNAYWAAEYGSEAATKTPDCASYDGVTGIITETGQSRACDTCPHNQYGSADNGRGKACKNMRRLYIMREGDMLPMVLSLPGTALRAYDNYRTQLILKRRTPLGVVTRIKLKAVKNAKDVKYSTPVFEAVGALPASEIERVKAFAAQFEGITRRSDILEDDAERKEAYVPSQPAPTKNDAPTEFVEVDDAELPF